MATIENAIHVCRIAERFLGLIADGTESGDYEHEPYPAFELIARDFTAWEEDREEEEKMVARIAPLLLKLTQELFDDYC